MKNTFKNLLIGAGFHHNGNYGVKRSTRTADLYRDSTMKNYHGRYYVGQSEICFSSFRAELEDAGIDYKEYLANNARMRKILQNAE